MGKRNTKGVLETEGNLPPTVPYRSKTIYAPNHQNQHVKAYGYFDSNYFIHSKAETIIFKIKIKYLKAVETKRNRKRERDHRKDKTVAYNCYIRVYSKAPRGKGKEKDSLCSFTSY